jgi:hypothetical protein
MAGALHGRPRAVALQGCAHFSGDPGTPDRVIPARHSAFYPTIIETNFGPPHCWMAPLDVVRQAGGFFEPLHWFEDWDLWWRVGLHASELVPIDYVGALYRQHPTSQFATISMANRTRGHAVVTSRMAQVLRMRPDLLADCGGTMLWALWTALKRARRSGVPWHELEPLAAALRDITVAGPGEVTKTRVARATRVLGVRLAVALDGLMEAAAS